jgi:hypothetical protein
MPHTNAPCRGAGRAWSGLTTSWGGLLEADESLAEGADDAHTFGGPEVLDVTVGR